MSEVHGPAAGHALWDTAATFDGAPDHGLREASVHREWSRLLQRHLPPLPARVLDAG